MMEDTADGCWDISRISSPYRFEPSGSSSNFDSSAENSGPESRRQACRFVMV